MTPGLQIRPLDRRRSRRRPTRAPRQGEGTLRAAEVEGWGGIGGGGRSAVRAVFGVIAALRLPAGERTEVPLRGGECRVHADRVGQADVSASIHFFRVHACRAITAPTHSAIIRDGHAVA